VVGLGVVWVYLRLSPKDFVCCGQTYFSKKARKREEANKARQPVLNIKQFLAFMPERTLDLGHVRFVTALSLMHNNNVFASNSSAHRCTAKVHRLGQPDLHCFYDESFNTDSKTTIQGH
jgi:hypothetical protein